MQLACGDLDTRFPTHFAKLREMDGAPGG
jgi:hypothetical protein